MRVLAPVNDSEDITPRSSLDTKVNANGITEIRQMTQAAYDALATKSSSTLYVIVG